MCAKWWNVSNVIPYRAVKFQNIWDFYVVRCPVAFSTTSKKAMAKKSRVISHRAETFESRGITGKVLTSLLTAMKTYVFIIQTDDVELEYIDMTTKYKGFEDSYEFIIYKENPDLKRTKSIYYAIRNSFAHGSFSVKDEGKERVYYLHSENKAENKARMRIYESTLLEWIGLIEHPSEIQKTAKTRKQLNLT